MIVWRRPQPAWRTTCEYAPRSRCFRAQNLLGVFILFDVVICKRFRVVVCVGCFAVCDCGSWDLQVRMVEEKIAEEELLADIALEEDDDGE